MKNTSQLFVFNDPFLQREEIFQTTKNLPGCYIWINNINKKCYVGSSLSLSKRLYFYYGYRTVKILYTSLIINALLCHGMHNFSLIVIILPKKEKESVLDLEQFLLDNYNSEYNILKVAGSTTGRELTQEHKAKISTSRENLKYSDESKALMSQTQFNLNSSKSIFSNGFINVYSPERILLSQFVSAKEAAKELSISSWSILKYIKSGLLFNNQYYFTFDLFKSDVNNLRDETTSNPRLVNTSTKPVKLHVYSPDLILLYEFSSISEAGRELEIPRTTISTYLDTRRVYKSRYIFSSSLVNTK